MSHTAYRPNASRIGSVIDFGGHHANIRPSQRYQVTQHCWINQCIVVEQKNIIGFLLYGITDAHVTTSSKAQVLVVDDQGNVWKLMRDRFRCPIS